MIISLKTINGLIGGKQFRALINEWVTINAPNDVLLLAAWLEYNTLWVECIGTRGFPCAQIETYKVKLVFI